jgi:hypothetical protein
MPTYQLVGYHVITIRAPSMAYRSELWFGTVLDLRARINPFET